MLSARHFAPPFPYSSRLLAPRPLPVPPVGTTTRKRKALCVQMLSYSWVHVIAPGSLPFAGLSLPLGFTRFRCLFPPLGVTRFRYLFPPGVNLGTPPPTAPEVSAPRSRPPLVLCPPLPSYRGHEWSPSRWPSSRHAGAARPQSPGMSPSAPRPDSHVLGLSRPCPFSPLRSSRTRPLVESPHPSEKEDPRIPSTFI